MQECKTWFLSEVPHGIVKNIPRFFLDMEVF